MAKKVDSKTSEARPRIHTINVRISAARVARYKEAGIDPNDSNAALKYARWKSDQIKRVIEKDRKPAKIDGSIARMDCNPHLAEMFRNDPKIVERRADLLRLHELRRQRRRTRLQVCREAESIYLDYLAKLREIDPLEADLKRIEGMMSTSRNIISQRKMALGAAEKRRLMRELHKKLGLPPPKSSRSHALKDYDEENEAIETSERELQRE